MYDFTFTKGPRMKGPRKILIPKSIRKQIKNPWSAQVRGLQGSAQSSNTQNGMLFKQCGNGKKWFGLFEDEVGLINTTLSGCGNATLDFGNCYEEGSVAAFKNGKELGRVDGLKNKKIFFEFFDGDSIEIRGYGLSVILLNNFIQDPCPNESKILIQ